MIIEEGYVYHVKNEYFEFVNDEKLMRNHEEDATRPNYFCLKMEDEEIMWFIPMSSKIEKYSKIIENKVKKYKKCDTIIIGNYRGRKQAFLIQNMFPTLEKYIEQEYKKAGISIKVPKAVTEEIDKKTRDIFALTNRGIVATFTNLPEFLRDIKVEKS